MPRYDFQDLANGEMLEVEMEAEHAVPIGDVLELEGRKLVRRLLPGTFQTCAVPTLYCPGAPSLPRAQWNEGKRKWDPPAGEPWHPPAQQYDSLGKPVFENQKAKNEFIARSGGKYAYGVD